ncbi:MAG: hypothetical protein DRP74_02950 [Candidatus Omnitrophota bacterium]|nr:MAG: hypothetical protein DRP74_02950 [Candidatus Omnitrophota bacterium]
MKKLCLILTTVIFTFSLVVLAQAQSVVSAPPIKASATIDEEMVIVVDVFRVDSKGTNDFTDDEWLTTPVSVMNFGTLLHTYIDPVTMEEKEAGCLYSSPYYYVALISAFTSGREYNIVSENYGLDGDYGTLIKGFAVTHIDAHPKDPRSASGYINATAAPADSNTGNPGLAAVGEKLLYYSGSAGHSRTIAVGFGIPPKYDTSGAEPYPGYATNDFIPVDTPSDTYSGDVTFSVVLVY